MKTEYYIPLLPTDAGKLYTPELYVKSTDKN